MYFIYSLILPFLLFTLVFAEPTVNVSDPYVWLEGGNDEAINEWLAKQKVQSTAFFEEDATRKWINNHLNRLSDIDAIGLPQQEGERCFTLIKKKGSQRPSIYEVTKEKTVRMVIDSARLQDATAALSGYEVAVDKSLIAYGVSLAGSDWQEWHFRNVDTGQELPDVLKEMKFGNVLWDKKQEGVYYLRYYESKKPDAYDYQELCYHRLGTEIVADQKLFSTIDKGGQFFGDLHLTGDGRYLLINKTIGAGSSNGIVYADLKAPSPLFVELFPVVEDIHYAYCGYADGRLFFVTNQGTIKGKVISINPSEAGEESVRTHIGDCDGFIQQAILVADKIVISYLKDATSRLAIYNRNGKLQQQVQLPRLCTASLSAIEDNQNTTQFFYSTADFVSPTTIYRADVKTGVSEVFLAPEISWNPDHYSITQVFYPSKDGTIVPMSIIAKRGVTINSNTALLLYGYGGFDISITPNFNATYLTWLDMGGIYAVANIRGGGEYGEPWHRAGMGENKQTVFDDFIAAAEWLCSHNYTQSSRLAIHGRSNGGLLVAACLLQRPDLFKAGIVGVGVLDMLRFHLFTVGKWWINEYGCPDDPKDFKILYAYSPYHQVKTGVVYPATLITTADHDDRVVPMHSFKFAAALQAAQSGKNPILLRVYENMGHGAGKSQKNAVEEATDFLYFLSKEVVFKN